MHQKERKPDMTNEIVRITKKKLEELKKQSVIVMNHTKDHSENRRNMLFPTVSSYPPAERLEEEWKNMDTRKSVPYLVFYSCREAYDNPDDPECQKTREVASRILSEYVDIIEDEDFEKVEAVTPGMWKSMSKKERVSVFRDLVSYYGKEEFDTFISDLGYVKLMGAYGYTQAMYRDGVRFPDLIRDLREIWDILQDY